MPVQLDPHGFETAALFDIAGDLTGLRLLEIGCGDGRLTQRYASWCAHVTAIDPDPARIALAQANLPPDLRGRVAFSAASLEDFHAARQRPAGAPAEQFDLALLSWSL